MSMKEGGVTAQEKKTHKLSDAEFWSILRENGGLFARTARAIERQFNISYGRAAVRQRANTNPDELQEIIEETLDIAEEGLFTLIRTGQPQTRLAAIKLFLDAKGKSRGYGKNGMEVKATIPGNEPKEGGDDSPMGMGGLNLTIKIMGND